MESGAEDVGWVLGLGREGLTRPDFRLGGRVFRALPQWAERSARSPARAPEAGWAPWLQRAPAVAPSWAPLAKPSADGPGLDKLMTRCPRLELRQLSDRKLQPDPFFFFFFFPFGSKSQLLAMKLHKRAGPWLLRHRVAGEETVAMTLLDTCFFCPLPSTTISPEVFAQFWLFWFFSLLRSLTSLSLSASLSPASKVTPPLLFQWDTETSVCSKKATLHLDSFWDSFLLGSFQAPCVGFFFF